MSEEKCSCGDRAKADCPGEWEPGCDLGNNPAHVGYAKVFEESIKKTLEVKKFKWVEECLVQHMFYNIASHPSLEIVQILTCTDDNVVFINKSTNDILFTVSGDGYCLDKYARLVGKLGLTNDQLWYFNRFGKTCDGNPDYFFTDKKDLSKAELDIFLHLLAVGVLT